MTTLPTVRDRLRACGVIPGVAIERAQDAPALVGGGTILSREQTDWAMVRSLAAEAVAAVQAIRVPA